MSQLLVKGGCRLTGEVTVQGAKNSVLPILAATLLTGSPVMLRGCPHLRDVDASIRILQGLGCRAVWEQDGLAQWIRPDWRAVRFLTASCGKCAPLRFFWERFWPAADGRN